MVQTRPPLGTQVPGAQQDLQSTTAFLRNLKDPGVRENVIFGMQEALAIRDPEAYIDWLTSTDWKLTGATASIGADRLARGNPQAAADAILRSNDARTHSSVFVESFVSTWSETDPIAALQWTTDHNLFDRVSNYSQIIQKWASEDAKAASQWLLEFEGDASTYSWAVTGLVSALADSIKDTQDYEAVFTWASLSNVRNGNLPPLLKDWLAQDPEAARAFFEIHDVRGISEDQLLNQPTPSSP